ncbi:histidinol-phosphatase HisJ [Niallia sp. 01092]|uniref:histidinol-phosphatase HisJ n=1 Tax=unclassified Niallia TaxID=2837522 RepID=UPI003FD04879
MLKKDGHIHTSFCPHGTKDALADYIEKAISLGFNEISFTEHAPLPKGFVDTTPTKDSSMSLEELPHYISEVNAVKEVYKEKIKVNVGLEIDYIEGFEKEIRDFLTIWGDKLDDSILSVHFLKKDHAYDCVDYSPDLFAEMIKNYGSVESIYDCYYKTVEKSIKADLGPFKPSRIGHITLVHKFQKKYPINKDYLHTIIALLNELKKQNLELDYNGAGVNKPLCGEPYPPKWIVQEAKKLQIPLIYGSDAHQVKDLGQGWDQTLGN